MDSRGRVRSMGSDQCDPDRHDRTALSHVHRLEGHFRTPRPFIYLIKLSTCYEYNDRLLEPATIEKGIILISSLDLELGFVESGIDSSMAEQVIMSTLFHQPPTIEHQDPVDIMECG